MAKTIQTAIEAGSRMAPAKFYIKITPDGPYLLYGNPPMDQEIIVPNDEGSSFFSLINIETITTVTTANTAKIFIFISSII